MSPKPRVKGDAWIQVAIFIALYALLLESLIEWVLVIYLYVIRRVDLKMMPSLIIALAASGCTIPLALLHSVTAWRCNRIAGFATRKTALHTYCIYLLRLSVAVWLACSVAGLVVVAQHASCLPEATAASSFWDAGLSCGLHRTVFIVSVVSFLTICVFFCSCELSDRPYSVSLLGIYKSQPIDRDESIFSNTSWDSESTLKNDISCLRRHPDGTPGCHCRSAGDGYTCKSMRHTVSTDSKPILKIDSSPGTDSSSHTASPESVFGALEYTSTPADFYPLSQTSTIITSLKAHPPPVELPSTTMKSKSHKRAKSSLSSLKKLIPKSGQVSLPLSADPQIRALSDPNQREKQVTIPSTRAKHQGGEPLPTVAPESKPRASSEAPEVVTFQQDQTQPSKHKSSRAYTSQIPLPPTLSINHPHHPNFVPPYPRPVSRTQTQTSSQKSNHYYHSNPETGAPQHKQHQSQGAWLPPISPPPRASSLSFRQTSLPYIGEPDPAHSTTPNSRPRSQIQRTSLSLQGHARRPLYTGISGAGTTAAPAAAFHRGQQKQQPHRASTHRISRDSYSGVEIVYPSTRRPRSSAGANFAGHLDSITEVSVSVGSADEGGESMDESVYRGADRTSIHV